MSNEMIFPIISPFCMVKWLELQVVASGFEMVTMKATNDCVQTTMHFQRRLIEVEVSLNSYTEMHQWFIQSITTIPNRMPWIVMCVCVCICVRNKPCIIWQNFRSKWEKLLRDYRREKGKNSAHTHTVEKYKRRSNLYIIKRELFLCSVMHAKCENEHNQRERESDEHRLYAWNSIRQSQLIDSCFCVWPNESQLFYFDVSVCSVRSMCVCVCCRRPAKKQIKQMAENHKENFYRFNEHLCVCVWVSERTNERQE